jgi:5'-nucleotidase
MEAAAMGIPALAVSLETDVSHHLSYSTEVDFSTAGYFTAYFARMLLERKLPRDVQVLKIDVPADATPQTPWLVTRLSRLTYFEPVAPQRRSWAEPGRVGYRVAASPQDDDTDSDVYTLRVHRKVSVTPISLDMTSRVPLGDLEKLMRNHSGEN